MMVITVAGQSGPMVRFGLQGSLIQPGCGRTGQETLKPLLTLFVNCKVVYSTVTKRISMFTQELQHLSLLFTDQMFVLNKDRERGMSNEIQALQNLIIMAFSVYV